MALETLDIRGKQLHPACTHYDLLAMIAHNHLENKRRKEEERKQAARNRMNALTGM